jgi:hypothetical protein
MDINISKITLRPGPLGRLHVLSLRVEGAREVAQAAINQYEVLKQKLDQQLTEACADEGMTIAPGQVQVNVDWQTGEVSRQEQPSNGLIDKQEVPTA